MMPASGLPNVGLIGAELTIQAVADARPLAFADPVGEAAVRHADRLYLPTVCTDAGKLLADPEAATMRFRDAVHLTLR